MKTETSEYAFAMLDQNGNYTQYGLTKREYFAAMATQGILSHHEYISPNQYEDVSKYAVQNADALIAELNKSI